MKDVREMNRKYNLNIKKQKCKKEKRGTKEQEGDLKVYVKK